jgi:hypothetical protein
MIFDSCTLVFEAEPTTLTSICQYWIAQGLSLKNPSNSKITMLDNEGDQIEISNIELLSNQRPISIQLWVSSDTDIIVSINKQWNLWVEDYSFDGIDQNKRIELITQLNNRISLLMLQTTLVGVIYDYKLRLADEYISINIS